jgi:predicted nucleic acid-binding protein
VLVVDASVIAPAVADDGGLGSRCRQRLRGERPAAPDLLRVEVLSVLRQQVSRRGLSLRRAEEAVADLLDLPVTVYPTAPLLRRVWELRGNVSAYDACYLALAEALDAVLLTADARLAAAPGLRCRVEVVG